MSSTTPMRFEVIIHRQTKQEFPPGLITVPPRAGGDGVHRIIVYDADLVASVAMQVVERTLVIALRDMLMRKQTVIGAHHKPAEPPVVDAAPVPVPPPPAPVPSPVEIARGARRSARVRA